MKYKVVDGALVPANEEDEKGGVQTFAMPSVKTEEDPIKELAGIVRDMAAQVSKSQNIDNEIKEEREKLEAEIRRLKEEMASKFVVPTSNQDKRIIDEDQKILNPYDLDAQGRQLVDAWYRKQKAGDNAYIMPQEKREDLAKCLLYFVKGWIFNDPVAKAAYPDFYRKVNSRYMTKTESATALGMTGYTFPVPDPLEAEILAFARESSVLLRYTRVWPMISDTLDIPRESSGITVSWGRVTSESNPTAATLTLTSKVLSAFSTVNQELLEDTISDIVGWITELMAEAIGQELDNSSFNGDGTSTYATCSGLLSAACGYSVVMASTSTAFSNLSASHLSEMIAKLDGKKKEGARFFWNGSVAHHVRTLSDTNGMPIFYPGSYGSGEPARVFGYPFDEVIKMPSTSAANTAFVVFGNMRYFALGRRIASMTLSVDPYGKWEENQVRYKIRNRWALAIGQPYGFVRLLTAAS